LVTAAFSREHVIRAGQNFISVSSAAAFADFTSSRPLSKSRSPMSSSCDLRSSSSRNVSLKADPLPTCRLQIAQLTGDWIGFSTKSTSTLFWSTGQQRCLGLGGVAGLAAGKTLAAAVSMPRRLPSYRPRLADPRPDPGAVENGGRAPLPRVFKRALSGGI
jgi:hypothetical protein